MLASVWCPKKQQYRYFEISQPFARPIMTPPNTLGWTIDEALPALPSGSRFVGCGDIPKGTIATMSAVDWKPWAVIGAFAIFLLVTGRKK